MADDTKKTTEEELAQNDSEVSSVEEESSSGMADALGLGDEDSAAEQENEVITTHDAPLSTSSEVSEVEEEPVTAGEPSAVEENDSVSDEEIEAAFVGTPPDSEPMEEDSDAEEDDAFSALEEESEEEELDEMPVPAVIATDDGRADGMAAYFDDPNELLHAAELTRDSSFEIWDAFSPFPIHGIEDAMGIGRSWLPWVTFGAGGTGFLLANALQFGTLTFDWPMIIGGKPHAPWPSFVPIMFELTVLIGGVTSALVMFIASGCFRKPRIVDPEITNDRFVIWIDAKDPNYAQAREFLQTLNPVEIRTVTF